MDRKFPIFSVYLT